MAAFAGASAVAPIHIVLDGNGACRTFQGIAAASGGGAVSRLLINYPEPQRSQILDYLFKPNYGASLQGLKVEIGGDGNSTEGSEPSHMHRADDENYQRGFEWWIMQEAKRRNPDIKLMALAWDFPGFLKDVNSQATADYLVKFLEGARDAHGLDIDYVGIWNETKADYDFIKRLKRTLAAHHLRTRIMADDLVNTWAIADAMERDPELRDAVDIVATHYPRFQSTEAARKAGKPIWSSEDGPWSDRWATAGEQSGPYAEVLNRNYIQGRMTSTTLWCTISSYYDILDVPYAGLMRAATPWSGHYETMPPLWIVAHTTQFAQPGWQYVDASSGLLPDGGSYVTLKKGADFSVAIETLAASRRQAADFAIQGGLSRGMLHLWRTNAQSSFERIQEISPRDGKFNVQLEPDAVYTITTTTGQQKGGAAAPPDKPFPLPYREDFEKYPLGSTTPDYFIEQNGSYEVCACGGGRKGQCLRQVVNQSPIVWTSGHNADLLGTASIIGDKSWSDYSVAADVLFEEPGYARVMGRVSRVTLEGQISGYQLYLWDSGKWELRAETKEGVLKSGQVTGSPGQWRRLQLSFDGNRIAASIDGNTVAELEDTRHAAGMAGIGNGWNIGQYDNLEIRPLVPGRPAVVPPRQAPAPLDVPLAPALYVPTALDQSVRLSWSPVEGARGYRVKYGSAEGQYTTAVDAGPRVAFKAAGLTNGTTYYFVVVAYNDRGESKFSNVMSTVPAR